MAAAQLSATLVTARLAPAATPPRTEPYKNPRNPKNPNHLHLQPLSSSSSSSASSGALQCPHFQSCSGCTHEWDLDRPQVLQEVSKFFEDRGVADFSFDIGRLWEWRCRAKLAIRGTPESPLVGLYQEGTHSVVDIPQCRAHHPSINAAVDLLKQGISKLSIQPFDEDLGTGELRYVQAWRTCIVLRAGSRDVHRFACKLEETRRNARRPIASVYKQLDARQGTGTETAIEMDDRGKGPAA